MQGQEILYFSFYCILFLLLAWRWRYFLLPAIPRWWMAAAFAAKIAAGIAYFFIFTEGYRGNNDSFQYFRDTQLIHEQWTENREVFWSIMSGEPVANPELNRITKKLYHWDSGLRYGLTNDVSTLLKLNVLIAFVSGGSFLVHGLFMSFFAFIGLAAIFKTFRHLFAGNERLLFAACFAIPSVIFWSSSIIKEAPLMLAFGLLLWSCSRLLYGPVNWRFMLLALLSLSLMIFLKEYVLIALLPALIFLVTIKFTGGKRMVVKFMVVHLGCFIVAQNAHHFFIGGDFLYVLNKKRVDFTNTAMLHDAQSLVEIPEVNNTFDFAMSLPRAFTLSYLRPFLTEAHTWPQVVAATENFIYMLLIALAILTCRKVKQNDLPLILASLSFVIVLASVIGNCVTIIGAMVRYRIPGLVLLVILCLYAVRLDVVKAKAALIRQGVRIKQPAQQKQAAR